MSRDWRVGRSLYDVLADHVTDGLDEERIIAAKLTVVTAVNYSPKRKQYQLAMRAPNGTGMTWHASANELRAEP